MHELVLLTVKGTGYDDMTDSALGEVVSPEASLETASDVSPSHPSSKDEGVSNDASFYHCRDNLFIKYTFLSFFVRDFRVAEL